MNRVTHCTIKSVYASHPLPTLSQREKNCVVVLPGHSRFTIHDSYRFFEPSLFTSTVTAAVALESKQPSGAQIV